MPKRALISVYDKTGLENFAKRLQKLQFTILATGNTARFLIDAGARVEEVSSYTGFPEILEGRVKTLHPKIHAGILARKNQTDLKTLEQLDIQPIDLVVVNLYPFESEPTVENIDIGGPALLRAAAKNHERVTAVCDPGDYERVASALEKGDVPLAVRKELAAKVFQRVAAYDAAIAKFFGGASAVSLQPLRYGENPHQKAIFQPGPPEERLWGEPLQGKELSYNNIVDADAAWWLIQEFREAPFACAVLKHNNPCGAAVSEASLADAFTKALACDSQSAFGGIVVCNREVEGATAGAMAKIFLEIILAPQFSKPAREILARKKNLRLLETRETSGPEQWIRSAGGGLLLQEVDRAMENPQRWQVVTKRKPNSEETTALAFAWKVVKHVKSNAIIFAGTDRTLGIGAGQMSRVDAVKMAVMKMNVDPSACQPVGPVVCASDAFFPFSDNIEAIAQAGATAVIQPGGSIKDQEVIQAADRHGLAMVFTGVRHFRH